MVFAGLQESFYGVLLTTAKEQVQMQFNTARKCYKVVLSLKLI